MKLSQRELDALVQYCRLIDIVPEIHEQWYQSEEGKLSEGELSTLTAKLEAELKACQEVNNNVQA